MPRYCVPKVREARQLVTHINVLADEQLKQDTELLATDLGLNLSQYTRRALQAYNAYIRSKMQSSESHQPKVKEQHE